MLRRTVRRKHGGDEGAFEGGALVGREAGKHARVVEQGDAEARVVALKRGVVHVQPRQRVAGAHQKRVSARGVAQIVAVTGVA